MRKIFSMIMVALVALFVATSCKLDNGTEPDIDRAKNLLWWHVQVPINQHYEHFRAVAYLNDTLLDRSVVEGGYTPSNVVVENNIYTIYYGATIYARSYRIEIDSKRLDEGGKWTIYYRIGTNNEYKKLGEVEGIIGETSKFNLLIDSSKCTVYGSNSCYSAESEMEYEYDKINECLCVKYNTFKGVVWDASAPNDYAINFEVVEPLVIRTSIEEGKVDILYKDLVDITSRQLSVVITNQNSTFVTPN